MARVGKIARLPEAVREELNKRLRGGQLGPQVLPWLNGLSEVRAVLQEFFSGQNINAQNLSDWRNGGYREWEEKGDRRYQRLERIKELSAMSMKLAQANGGNLSEGAASILGGSILEVLEQLEDFRNAIPRTDEGSTAEAIGAEKIKAMAESIDALTNAVARIRRGDHDKEVLRQNDLKLKQKDEELALAREKFQRDTAALFIKWCEDKRALEAATGGGDNSEKIERLGQLMFGEDWRPQNSQKETKA